MIKNIIFDVKKNKRLFFKVGKLLFIIAFLLLLLIIISFYFHKNVRLNKEKIYSHQEIFVDDDFEYQIYYDNESNPEIFTDAIVGAINSAKESIELAIYSMNINDVIDALINKRNQGVDVKIIFPEKRRKEAESYFKNSEINLIFSGKVSDDKNSDLMHHKFLIIDSESENRSILFGSMNFTDYQTKFDSSYLIETSDREVIDSFKNEFTLLASGKNSIRKLKDSSYRIFSKKINYNNGFIELWFGPGTNHYSIKSRMIELINLAKQKIEIISWQFNDNILYNSLIDRANSGVDIKVIVDDLFIWSGLSSVKKVSQIEVISDAFNNYLIKNKSLVDETIPKQFNPYVHHHFMVIDEEILVTGTNNWGFAGFYLNDENILVTNMESLIKDFSLIFDQHYKKNRNTKLDFKLIDNNKIVLNQEFPKNSKIVLYIDNTRQNNSYFEVCYEENIKTSEIVFPSACNKQYTLIFIVDEKGKLLSSGYLN
jgi:phosphatidylserine/phosphatidylglycerophosphate/cardiolipin synthase-like enzyme